MTGLDRRKFLKRAGVATAGTGALWVTPSVLGLDQAFAVASCKAPATLTAANWMSDTSFVGWQGTGSGNLGPFSPPLPASVAPYNVAPFDPTVTGGTQVPMYLVEQDPVAGIYAYTQIVATYTSTGFVLTAGSTFTFTFNVRWRDTNNHVATQQLLVQYSTTPAVASSWISGYSLQTSTAGTGDNLHDVTGANFSLPITAANAGTYFLRYAFSFQGTVSTATNQRANDVAITLPTATCK